MPSELKTQLRKSIELVDSEQQTEGFTRDKVDLIKKMVAKDCSDDELHLFLYTAKRTGLDPLARQIYAVKRSGKMAIQTGIDGYRLIADRTGKLAGISDYLFDSEETKFPGKATVTVKKLLPTGEMADFTATARWREYNAGGPMWVKMPYLMLGKCAEALALRKAFPADLSGVYTTEEMQQADAAKDMGAVYDEVARQKAGLPPSEELTTKVLEGLPVATKAQQRAFIYEDGDLLCSPIATSFRTTKDEVPFFAVKINGKVETSDMIFCWHQSLFSYLEKVVDKECQFKVSTAGKFTNIEEIVSIDGVRFAEFALTEDDEERTPF